jgi:hypothetical protein
METTDQSILAGLKREKDEEVGPSFKIKVFPFFTTNILFTKKDGSAMILPHIYAIHLEGEIQLSEEYSEYKWVKLDEIDKFEPKINTIPDVLNKFALLKKILSETKFEVI